MVKVQYLGQVRAITNKREETLDMPTICTVFDLLQTLSTQYGPEFEQEVFQADGAQLQESIIITVNGVAIGQLKGLNTSIGVSDIVAILPLFAGGG